MAAHGHKLLRIVLEWQNVALEVQEHWMNAGLEAYVRENPRAFGELLRELRLERELSLKEAADLLGISFSGLGRLERGEKVRPPSRAFIELLGKTYEAQIDRELRALGLIFRGDKLLRSPAEDPSERQRLENLLLGHALKSTVLDKKLVTMIPDPLVKAWLEFARKLEAHLQSGGEPGEVLELENHAKAERGQAPPDGEEA